MGTGCDNPPVEYKHSPRGGYRPSPEPVLQCKPAEQHQDGQHRMGDLAPTGSLFALAQCIVQHDKSPGELAIILSKPLEPTDSINRQLVVLLLGVSVSNRNKLYLLDKNCRIELFHSCSRAPLVREAPSERSYLLVKLLRGFGGKILEVQQKTDGFD